MRSLEFLEASRDSAAAQSPAAKATLVAQARAIALKALNAIQAKNIDQALEFSGRSEREWRSLCETFPGDHLGHQNRLQMAHSLQILGQVYEVQGDLEKSESLLSEAIEIYAGLQHLVLADNVGDRANIARTHHCWGIAVARQDRLDEARVAYGRAISMLKNLVSDFPYFALAQEYSSSASVFAGLYGVHLRELRSRRAAVAGKCPSPPNDGRAISRSRLRQLDRAGDNYGVLSVIQRERPDTDVERQVEYLRQAVSAYEQSWA